ncbi:MAG: CDP-alcohol phosphatidyltransferase family protein [Acidobacteriia bacterium]|nr:CDP-alcohol phosphatidyltransferase family protein [Terriglobia bacterium]
MATDSLVRRPLKSRNSRWASLVAGLLIRASVPPNVISVLSILFAVCAGASFLLVSRVDNIAAQIVLYLSAAVFIQLRLLCNLMDGMVAVEGGVRSRSGEVFNELPDRISDVVVLVSIGYSLAEFRYARELAWSAALLAVLTAYIRLLGGSLRMPQDFSGPMAKPHRMAILTVAALLSIVEALLHYRGNILMAALVIVAVGSIITFARRTAHLIRWLEDQ